MSNDAAATAALQEVDSNAAAPSPPGGWQGELADAVKNRTGTNANDGAPNKAGNNNGAENGASANDKAADDDDGDDGETYIDPTRFAPNPEGLSAFLAKIDGPNPLLDGKEDAGGAESSSSPGTTDAVATYRAKSVQIEAGSSREVPVPVWTAGSKVTILTVGVDDDSRKEGVDVGFGVFLTRPAPAAAGGGGGGGGDGEAGRAETEHAANVTVLREPGRIVTLGGGGGGTKADGDDDDGDDDDVPKGEEPAMEFTVSSAPSTVVLTFDNSYSWLTPKKVSYEVRVDPPVDQGLVRRSRRAEKALESVIHEMRKTNEDAAKIRKVREAVEKEANAIEDKVKAGTVEVGKKRGEVEDVRAAIGQAEEAVEMERTRVSEAMGLAQETSGERAEIETRISELRRKLAEAQAELEAKAGQLEEREGRVEERRVQVRQAESEVLKKREEMKQREEEVVQIVEANKRDEEKIEDVAKEFDIIREEEGKVERQSEFLKSQFEALQLRLLDKLQEI